MVLKACVVLCVTEPDFFWEKKKGSKIGENEPKIGFFEFIGNFSFCFFLNLVYNETLYYLLYSYTNLMLGKI